MFATPGTVLSDLSHSAFTVPRSTCHLRGASAISGVPTVDPENPRAPGLGAVPQCARPGMELLAPQVQPSVLDSGALSKVGTWPLGSCCCRAQGPQRFTPSVKGVSKRTWASDSREVRAQVKQSWCLKSHEPIVGPTSALSLGWAPGWTLAPPVGPQQGPGPLQPWAPAKGPRRQTSTELREGP